MKCVLSVLFSVIFSRSNRLEHDRQTECAVSSWRKHPFIFGVAMSAFKTSASDFFAQTVVEQREQVQHDFIDFML